MLFFWKFFLRRRFITLVILLSYGCGGPIHLAAVSVNPSQSYRLQKEANGLAVAIDPYVEEDRLTQYFGANLLQHKLVPVFFVIENRGQPDGFMVESSQIAVALRDKAAKPGADPASVNVPATDKNLLGVMGPLAFAGIAVPVAGLAALALLPFLVAAENQRDKAAAINANLTKKALVDRTLYPGETTSGFVYFPLSQPGQLGEIAGFAVKVKNLKTDQVVEIVLPSR